MKEKPICDRCGHFLMKTHRRRQPVPGFSVVDAIVGPADAPTEPEPVKVEALWVCRSRRTPGSVCPGEKWILEGS